jgi:hypothetical protein
VHAAARSRNGSIARHRCLYLPLVIVVLVTNFVGGAGIDTESYSEEMPTDSLVLEVSQFQCTKIAGDQPGITKSTISKSIRKQTKNPESTERRCRKVHRSDGSIWYMVSFV